MVKMFGWFKAEAVLQEMRDSGGTPADISVDELLGLATDLKGLARHKQLPVDFLRSLGRHDLELGGKQIKTGEMVLCSLSGANRDPELGPHMQDFDPDRIAPHLAFGWGAHFCFGAPLARIEGQVALAALVKRFERIETLLPDGRRVTFYRQLATVAPPAPSR